jgi:hypothetical protein
MVAIYNSCSFLRDIFLVDEGDIPEEEMTGVPGKELNC